MEDMSNQNNGEEEWSKAKDGGHLLDEARSETAIGVKGDVPATFTVEDENEGMDWNVQQVFGMVELLSNILNYLPTCDIKSCNGLSSLWRQEGRKLLLLRTRMEFGGGGQDVQLQVDSYIEEMGDNCHQSMSVDSLGNGDAERFAITRLGNKYGYKIKKLYMTMGNPDILRCYTNVSVLSVSLDLDNFINIPQDLIMPSVKTLSFRVKQPQTLIESLETSLHELTQSQSAFELWKASLFNHEVAVIVNDVKTGFVQSLLRMCPMMEHLDLDGAAQTPFLHHFEKSEHYRRSIPNQLSSLALNGSSSFLSSPSVRLLNSLGALRLTMLKIAFYGMDDNLDLRPPTIPALQKNLAAFALTLKHFKLYRIPFRPNGVSESTVTFPEMPKLETLEITHISVPLLKFIFGDGTAHGINYMLQFPVLKKLSIKSVDRIPDESGEDGSLLMCEMFFPEGTLPCPTLTRIGVDCISGIKHGNNCKKEGYCFCNKEGRVWNMLKRLITMFPNVEEFKKCGGWQW